MSDQTHAQLIDDLVAAKSDPDAIRWILDRYTKTLAGMIDAADQEHQQQQAAAKPKYHVPGPYEIALALGCALATSGRFETPGAALTAAWMAIPEFYAGRDAYLRDLAPVIAGLTAQPASPAVSPP